MASFTLTDLDSVLRNITGYQLTSSSLDDTHLDTPFDALGIDSVGLVELAHVLANHGAPVPAEIIEDLRTPRLVLDHVNRHLSPQ
ncbi:acyl carrier protein [Streptomyces sp. NPDC101227]|uniref:acyl carrier protein n=1 Tax=Streptomyces sp. NPDC101227 TaxID=3366136 RepID=UPI003804FE3B